MLRMYNLSTGFLHQDKKPRDRLFLSCFPFFVSIVKQRKLASNVGSAPISYGKQIVLLLLVSLCAYV